MYNIVGTRNWCREMGTVNVIKNEIIFIAECSGTNVLLPEPNTPGAESFTISTSTVLLALSTFLDFEVATEYILEMNIIDQGTNLEGSLVVKVKHFIASEGL